MAVAGDGPQDFSQSNACLRAWKGMLQAGVDVSRGEVFLPSDAALRRFEARYGAEVASVFLPEILRGHANPLPFPAERQGRRVVTIGGIPVGKMRCTPQGSLFVLDGLLVTPEHQELLDACGVPDVVSAVEGVDTPGSRSSPSGPSRPRAQPPTGSDAPEKDEGGIVSIQGREERQKIDTRQIREAARPKGKRGAERRPTVKELTYIQAKRLQILGGDASAIIPPPPARLAPGIEEFARRQANLQDPPTPRHQPPIPREVLVSCLPRHVELRPHQLRVVEHLLTNRGVIAAHSVGSGKTLIAATCAACVLKFAPASHVIFISPKSLLLNFRRAFVAAYSETAWKRVATYTYEKFLGDYKEGLIDGTDAFLIVDEAHRLRTRSADKDSFRQTGRIEDNEPGKIVKAVLKCARRAAKVLMLTATPLVNDPLDIANLAAILRGDVFPIAKKDFHHRVFSKVGQIVDLSAFRRCFGGMLSVYTRPQDGNYPTVETHVVRIPMTARFCEEYQRVEVQALSKIQRDVLGPNDLEPFYNGIRRASNADIEGLNTKLDWVRRHLLRFNARKVVIFSPFISLGVRQLEQLVADFDVKPSVGVIEGKDTEEERQAVVDAFNADKLQVLLISVQAGGLGINLVGARDVIIMQPGWNDVETQQAMGRAVRFRSHDHLPPKERRVDMWKLLLVKPAETGGAQSADEIMRTIAERKQGAITIFSEALWRCSIEEAGNR